MDFWNLTSIEAFIVSIALLLLTAYVLKIYRRRSRSRFLRWILLIFDAISNSVVTYSIGLMQQATEHSTSAPFSIWALVLLILDNNYQNDFDRSKVRRHMSLLAYLMNYLFTAFLNLSTKYDIISLVVWFLWLLHLCKLVLRSWIFELADTSYRHGKNSRLIADYMPFEHELSKQEECNPATMDGYKYLVHGEGKSKSKLEPTEHDYLVKLEVGNEEKLITLEKVWHCKGPLLDSNGDPDCNLKDLCLSFALYKLIRRRFDHLHPPPVADHRKAHVLIHEGLLSQGKDYKRVFRVIGTELAFLSDYFNSMLPALLFIRYRVFYTLILVSFGMSLWLLVIIARRHQRVITIVLVCMVILAGVFEVMSYVFSDWTKLLLLCTYVEHPSWHGNALVERLLRFFCGLKFFKHLHNNIGQYHLLKSFCHDSILRYSFFHDFILRRNRESTETKFKTRVREGPRVKVPEEAKEAIFDSLREQISLEKNFAAGHPAAKFPVRGRLSNGTVSLQRNEVDEQLLSGCMMRKNVHTILVWHVATCLCEINMSLSHGVARRSIRNCFRPASFMLDWRSLNEAKLQANYVVASSLSQYCAYLLVFCPNLLRYHELTINYILKKTAVEAQEILKDGRAPSIKNLYDRLWDAAGGADEGEEADNVMRMGARLGRTLVDEIADEERIWKVLAEFWAEMVLYIAPCVNKDAHEKYLNTGGEFLTHLWALLHHAGINEIDDEAPIPEVAEEKKICQYHLLKSFCHDSILRCSRESTKKFKTRVKEGPWVKVPEEAEAAIFDSLSKQIKSGQLSNGTVSLQQNEVDEKLSWACKMSTNVHTILVWHVATCLCEVNMSLRHCVAGRSVRNCFGPSSFILDWRSLNGAKLQANYVVASSFSQYCAYLLVFCPNLLRYHELTINYILKKTAVEAQEILKDGRAPSIKKLYDRLWDAAGGADEGEEADNVMRMGARLGRTLVDEIADEERIWKVLAEFWAEMVLYIAPCVNKDAHENHLNTGGEFLTHLWALLHHAGINEIDDEAEVAEEKKHQPAPPAASQSNMC